MCGVVFVLVWCSVFLVVLEYVDVDFVCVVFGGKIVVCEGDWYVGYVVVDVVYVY